ncbi:hypothetical protein [Enterococcus sp. LJL51]|uniref:hypothetical protein n=1 Tax=Enterococcus sp. LJL51 TaxID=3416656 RepID=UPI003CE720A6
MKKIDKWKMEEELQKALAIEFVSDYCRENKLSINKLEKQRFSLSYNECGFLQPSDVKPNGLINDQETMSKATLIIRKSGDELIIEETPYTREYLKK